MKTTWSGEVDDNFDDLAPHAPVPHWNIYRPRWAEVYVNDSHQLCLTDSDRYDYARAIRVFEAKSEVEIALDVMVKEEGEAPFEIDVTDRHGERIACRHLSKGAMTLCGQPVGTYTCGQWQRISLHLGNGQVTFGHQTVAALHSAKAPERLSLRTGDYRCLPDRQTPNQDPCPPLPGCDERVAPTTILIDNVKVK